LADKPLDAKIVAMIQCVGSRNSENPMCSRVCCIGAMKNAIKIMKTNPKALVYIFYKDIRTYGLYEDLYTEAAKLGVVFIRTRDEEMPELIKDGNDLVVSSDDITLDGHVHLRPDLVVLSTGIRPNPDNEELAKMLKVPLSKDGFFLEAHMKLRPVDFAHGGDIPGRAGALAEDGRRDRGPGVRRGRSGDDRPLPGLPGGTSCDQHRRRNPSAWLRSVRGDLPVPCDRGRNRRAWGGEGQVNPALCKGCGACEVACCSGAITCKHFTNRQIIALVEACLEGASK